jgi:hypothetical protein
MNITIKTKDPIIRMSLQESMEIIMLHTKRCLYLCKKFIQTLQPLVNKGTDEHNMIHHSFTMLHDMCPYILKYLNHINMDDPKSCVCDWFNIIYQPESYTEFMKYMSRIQDLLKAMITMLQTDHGNIFDVQISLTLVHKWQQELWLNSQDFDMGIITTHLSSIIIFLTSNNHMENTISHILLTNLQESVRKNIE